LWKRWYLQDGECPDSGFWILDSGFWILDSGFWILDSGFFCGSGSGNHFCSPFVFTIKKVPFFNFIVNAF
jgi:hypothetical protein